MHDDLTDLHDSINDFFAQHNLPLLADAELYTDIIKRLLIVMQKQKAEIASLKPSFIIPNGPIDPAWLNFSDVMASYQGEPPEVIMIPHKKHPLYP